MIQIHELHGDIGQDAGRGAQHGKQPAVMAEQPGLLAPMAGEEQAEGGQAGRHDDFYCLEGAERLPALGVDDDPGQGYAEASPDPGVDDGEKKEIRDLLSGKVPSFIYAFTVSHKALRVLRDSISSFYPFALLLFCLFILSLFYFCSFILFSFRFSRFWPFFGLSFSDEFSDALIRLFLEATAPSENL